MNAAMRRAQLQVLIARLFIVEQCILEELSEATRAVALTQLNKVIDALKKETDHEDSSV